MGGCGEVVMASFVVRFTQEIDEAGAAIGQSESVGIEAEAVDHGQRQAPPRWRVLVRHIQSGEERLFTDFAQAMEFIEGRVSAFGYQHQLERSPEE
ncbi:MAG: hypothetical protein VB144_11185 [Clostridia bacterium]|nr:hypothetical protein [Clostridia bacterium]